MEDLPLAEKDPEIFAIINGEDDRQRGCLELIASENFTSKAVM
jgi:glycine hydroxymethyltransferase